MAKKQAKKAISAPCLTEPEVAILLSVGRYQVPLNALEAQVWAGLQARCRAFAAEKSRVNKEGR